ncbi:diaminopimelate epimerase [Bacillus anthracis]|nr:diaminopimelate epimerase [Bacillus cereus]PFE24357.1 diaminopimelate epimerase [Bacillus anthracis]
MDKRKETIVTVSMVKLNIYAFLIIFALAFGIGYLHIFLSGGVQFEVTLLTMFLFIIAMLVLVCIHEAIHLIGFRYIGGVPWSELTWGVNWKLGVAYAHSKQAITVKQMKKVLMLPFLPTGILPIVIGLATNMPSISFLGILLTAGCMGDIALYQKVSKFPDDAQVKDHPSKPQFTVYES